MFAKVMFLHVSVILSTGGGCLDPGPGGRLGGLARGGVSRPRPRGEVGRSGRGGVQAQAGGGGLSQHALECILVHDYILSRQIYDYRSRAISCFSSISNFNNS